MLEVFEDPFSSHQEESPEGLSHNSIESVLQRNRELSFPPGNYPEEVFSRPARSFITEEILEALRKADRKGRDVVVGLSNACCKWGCSKSEISSLCWGTFFLRRFRNLHTQPSSSTPHGPGVIFLNQCLSVTWYVYFLWEVTGLWPCLNRFSGNYFKCTERIIWSWALLFCTIIIYFFIWCFSFVIIVFFTKVLNWW